MSRSRATTGSGAAARPPGWARERILDTAYELFSHHGIRATGVDTIVGDRGAQLSGVQRQRVAIARAFLKNSPILLLDEATSALDIEAEEAIREALSRLMQGRTVIAVAHRLSTLRNFDRIIVLQNGKIVQDGEPERLLQADGPYRTLVMQEVKRLSRQAA